jgi:short-subunit dehydrogenase
MASMVGLAAGHLRRAGVRGITPGMHVVVTGASSGIGAAIARAFDRADVRISLVARRKGLLEKLQADIAARTQAIAADLGDANDAIAWLRQAEETFGPTDVLVNNAGISYVEPVGGVDQERIRAIFQVNVHTPIAAIHHVMPAMVARKQGTIVNVLSNAAFSPAPYFCHYTASKGALGNFSESLRMELARTGVHVLSVYPGPIHTPMGDRNWNQLKNTASSKLAPIGDPETLARRVLRAVDRRKARVIYPRFYTLGWWLPGVGRWVAERFVPEATGEKTPLLGGDVVGDAAAAGSKPVARSTSE